MPSTQELIAYIWKRAPGVDRDDIREVLNDLQNFVYSRNKVGMRYIDPLTGKPPYLVTTAAAGREYSFPDVGESGNLYPVNVRRSAVIFTADNVATETYGRFLTAPIVKDFQWGGREYNAINHVWFERKSIDTPARVIFPFDPGDTTETYFLLFYIWPVQITAETVAMTIPEAYHVDLREGALGILKNEMYGALNAWEYFKQKTCKKIWTELNRGGDIMGKTPLQYYDQAGMTDFVTSGGSRRAY